MPCAESMRVQAYFDGELDAVAAADIEQHIDGCAECRALLADLEATRTLICREAYGRASPALRERITRVLDQEAPAREPRPDRPRLLACARGRSVFGALGGMGAAVAATTAFFFTVCGRPQCVPLMSSSPPTCARLCPRT